MAFDANGNLLETNDGGIYRRSNPQSSTGQWTSLIGNLQVSEMYDIAYDATPTPLFPPIRITASPPRTWSTAHPVPPGTELGADGGTVAVNDQNAAFSVRYMSSQALGDFTRIKVVSR